MVAGSPLADDRAFADLTKHPGWAEWERAVALRIEAETVRLAKKLLKTEEPIDLMDIQYRRGYLKGCLDVLRQPEKAAEKLEKE